MIQIRHIASFVSPTMYSVQPQVMIIKNKAATHHRHIFCFLTLLKIPFRRIKLFLSRKNTILFPNSKFYDFCKKPSIQVQKRHFYEIISMDTHSTANSPPNFYQKTPNFVRFDKFYYFGRILRPICYNLVI